MNSIGSHFMKAIAVLGLAAGMAINLQASETYQGYLLYNQTCFLCHGDAGKGNGPLAEKLDSKVSDLTEKSRMQSVDDRTLFRLIQGTIKHGSGNSMPQWGLALAEPQIDSIVAYVRFLQHAKEQLPGNPKLGEQVYMDNCAACHGRQGKGDGPLTNVMRMNAADHTNSAEMNKQSNSRLIEIVTHGSPGKSLMPAWSGRLSKEEIEGVVSYIRLLSSY